MAKQYIHFCGSCIHKFLGLKGFNIYTTHFVIVVILGHHASLLLYGLNNPIGWLMLHYFFIISRDNTISNNLLHLTTLYQFLNLDFLNYFSTDLTNKLPKLLLLFFINSKFLFFLSIFNLGCVIFNRCTTPFCIF